ncbi:MAG TPA: fibronectin type III domain-containing protein, partial [Thermodesulfovibrionales bacterium]|nr:fibronectin type III domain-containing protein [Thermodesulfovibrionales bacterium]
MKTRHMLVAVLSILLIFCQTVSGARLQALSAPINVDALAVSSSQINLTWDDVNSGKTNESGYSIERSLSGTGGFVKIATVARNGTSYNDVGLASGTTYYYKVQAIGKKGVVSIYSNVTSATTFAEDTTAPTVPTGLTATAASCSQVNLSWTASTDTGGSGLKGYNVYKNGSYLKQVLAPATSTTDSGLAASSTYSYTILAVDNAGNPSAQSAPASASTPAYPDTTAPTVPLGLNATAASCSQVNLSWTASTDTGGSGLKGYNIYKNGSYLKQVLAPATSTTDSGLAASSTYSYTILAV